MGRRRSDALSIYYELKAGVRMGRNIKKMNELVEDEDPFAYYAVGKIYEEGIKGIEPNAKKSKKYLDKAYPRLIIMANRGNEDAEAILRELDGTDEPASAPSQVAAKAPVKPVAPKEAPVVPAVKETTQPIIAKPVVIDPMDIFQPAIEELYNGKKLDKALKLIRKEVKKNNGYASYLAGAILRYGIKGLDANVEGSDEYFKKAFDILKDKQEKTAFRFIAALYRDGFGGVEIDIKKSLLNFAHASNYGDAKSSIYLSKYYNQSHHFDAAKVSKYINAANSQGASLLQIEVGFGKAECVSKRRDITINPFPTEQMSTLKNEVKQIDDSTQDAKSSVVSNENQIEESAGIETLEEIEGLETRGDIEIETIENDIDAVGVVHADAIKLDFKDISDEETVEEDVILPSDTLISEDEYIKPTFSEVVLMEELSEFIPEEVLNEDLEKEKDKRVYAFEVTRNQVYEELKDNDEELAEEDAEIKAEKYLVKAIQSLRSKNKEVHDASIILAKKSARYSSVRALVFLGYAYEKGIVVTKNLDVASCYYEMAIEKNSSTANYRLGMMNIGIDKAKALSHLRKAAKLGNTNAMVEIGNLYYEGEVGSRNPQIAERFYKLAADRADAYAFYNLYKIEMHYGNQEKADEYLVKAYSLGYKDSSTVSI